MSDRGRDFALIQRALEALPAVCRYHGERFEQDYGMHGTGSCCDTGRPSLYRFHAEAALKRVATPYTEQETTK